jgi:hypothetical protein
LTAFRPSEALIVAVLLASCCHLEGSSANSVIGDFANGQQSGPE